MSEMIKREDVIKITWQEPYYYDSINVLLEVRDKVRALPTIDAVEVVRCKDCKYADVLITGNIYCKHFNEWHLHGTDWFCADGERKEKIDEIHSNF
jgi:hypothetical protein